MAMRWNLLSDQGYRLRSGGLAQGKPWTHMDGKPALQVRQREGALSIAAVGCPDQVEERVVFRNGYQSSITERPPYRGEVSSKHSYLTYEW
jgi:hypothetical protein